MIQIVRLVSDDLLSFQKRKFLEKSKKTRMDKLRLSNHTVKRKIDTCCKDMFGLDMLEWLGS